MGPLVDSIIFIVMLVVVIYAFYALVRSRR